MLEMTLLDWTRMGGTCCLAGAVLEEGRYRIVRPLMVKNRGAGHRKIGWWFRLLEGHSRWEVFELVQPTRAEPEPPHVEDVWVVSLRSRGRLASPEQRRAILEATLSGPGAALFGEPLLAARAAAYLKPGTGRRSLATVRVPAASITFAGAVRQGMVDPDFRVQLPVPDIGPRWLAVKDYQLLQRVRSTGTDMDVAQQIATLQSAVRGMGETVAVRLGLSRAFQQEGGAGLCWLMADGFFSWSDPQP
jgi:hypothetical protein